MALTHGKNGAVYLSAGATAGAQNKIASTTSWSLNVTGDPAEVRRHGDNWVTRLAGISDWNCTIEALLDLSSDQTLISQRLFATGNATIGVSLRWTSATIPRYEGVVLTNEVTPAVPADGSETLTIAGVGNGTLTFIQ